MPTLGGFTLYIIDTGRFTFQSAEVEDTASAHTTYLVHLDLFDIR